MFCNTLVALSDRRQDGHQRSGCMAFSSATMPGSVHLFNFRRCDLETGPSEGREDYSNPGPRRRQEEIPSSRDFPRASE